MLRGEAGIGKTELLTYLVTRAAGCRIVRAVGVESEMELSYAGLHQLCSPLLAALDDLPQPPTGRAGRRVRAPRRGCARPVPRELAALSLLAEAGGNQPLVCVIDDAQWLDHESALTVAFVARRLLAESVDRTEETDDGFDGPEGSFTICSFGLVSALCAIGEHDRAEQLCSKLLNLAGPLDLYAEQIDRRHLGNFAQSFTHLALIHAVLKVISVSADGGA